MDCMCADKRLWEIRLIFFLMFAGLSCFIPYATLYSYHLGLTASQVGLIWGLEPLVSFLCAPMWGSIADKYSKHKQILMTCIICSSALWLSLLFIPPIYIPVSNKFPVGIDVGNCTAPSSVDLKSCPLPNIKSSRADVCVPICSTNTEMENLTSSSLVCDYESGLGNCDICLVDNADLQNYLETESNDTSTDVPSSYRLICDNGSCESLQCCNCQEDNGRDSGNPLLTFSLCICLVLAGAVFDSVTMPLVDALCFGILAEKGGGDYGRQRLWGAVGWGIFAFLSGIAVDEYNKTVNSHRTHYDPIFYMYAGFAVLDFLSIAFIRFPPHKSAERMTKNLRLLFQNSYIVAYFILVSVMGMGFGISIAYLFLFMDELKSSYLVMGLSQMITTLTEISCFFVSGPIIKRIGHNGVFCLGFLAYFVRFLGYSFAPIPWVILPFQVLHGITFGLLWAAATSYATLIAPKGMVATLQSICTGLHFGIGNGVGIGIGGLIYEEFGSRNLFRAFAGLNFVSLVLYYLYLCSMGIEVTKPPSDVKDTNQVDGKTEKTANDDPEADIALQMNTTNDNHTDSAD